MSIKRENAFLEASKSLRENRAKLIEKEQRLVQESIDKKNKFVKDYYSIKESREEKDRVHAKLLESAKDNSLSTVLKAIYISALEANTLTDNAIFLAENMVDKYISERGGASKILSECGNKTYLLSRITQIVEDAAEEDVKDVEKDEDKEEVEDKKNNDVKTSDDENTKEEESKESDDKEDSDDTKTSEDEKSDADDIENKDDTSETEESKEKSKESDKDDSDNVKSEEDPLNVIDIDKDGDPSNDDTEAADELIDDIEIDTTPVSIDGDGEENKGKVFEELEKEEDVQKAVELIRQRVADAEEAFIKRNAEDKKQIDDLLEKISDNVKTVEDLADNDSTKTAIAEESARLNKQRIKEITENRKLTVFEKMARQLCTNIVKESSIKEKYLTENGNLDTGSIIESAKVMYAFLETINTLQIEKVDKDYIQNILVNM